MELLSPAGSFDALKSAVNAGCDAVYFGVAEFNARVGASNATLDNLEEWVAYAHLYSVKVYVTVNTLIKPREVESVTRLLVCLYNAGVDGIIVQDIGVASIARQVVPSLELHASTQMTVNDLAGALYLKNYGFKRVVLSRELSKQEIEYIKKQSGLEIEVFVHGAICMSYSGQCLMSSMIGGRSGNRGECAQPCRLPYEIVKDGKSLRTGYLLSPKDMSLIDELSTLNTIGVDSLKIEGRLKRPEYVATVTNIYRRYIDSLSSVTDQDHRLLLDAFNRGGFTSGYFTSKLGASMMCYDNPSNVAQNKFSQLAIDIVNGRSGKKIPIKLFAEAYTGTSLKLRLTDYDGNSVECESDSTLELALNHPLDEAAILTRLSKLGQTPFVIKESTIKCDGVSILSASDINNTRRKACEMLTILRINANKPANAIVDALPPILPSKNFQSIKPSLVAYAYTVEQARACIDEGIERLYVPSNVLSQLDNVQNTELIRLCDPISESDAFEGSALLQNIGQAYLIKDISNAIIGHRFNITNAYSAQFFKNCRFVTLSCELSAKEIKQIALHTDARLEAIVYGKLPLMTMRNCPLKSAGYCQKQNLEYSLRDRKGIEFDVFCTPNCRAVLLNSRPIYVADRIQEIVSIGLSSMALMFTTEDYSKTKQIISEYATALLGGNIKKKNETEFTRGYYFK